MRIRSKVSISEYNNRLESILEKKKYTSETKNLLLSMLYKVENSLNDYIKIKANKMLKKEKIIEEILNIIEKECEYIETVTPKTEESRELELKNIKCIIDENLGKIIVFANEEDLLYSIYLLHFKYIEKQIERDEKENINKEEDFLIYKAIQQFIINGNTLNKSEIIRDFNGWSWNTSIQEKEDIVYNLIYQNILLILNKVDVLIPKYKVKQENIFNIKTNTEDLRKLNGIIEENEADSKNINVTQKDILHKELRNAENREEILKNIEILLIILLIKNDVEMKNKVASFVKEKKSILNMMNNKEEFLNKITENKKIINKKIKNIDEIINDKKQLQEEYNKRNKKLENKYKIFSVSHLVKILEKEREELLNKLQKLNKMLSPKGNLEEKELITRQYTIFNSAISSLKKDNIETYAITLQKSILEYFRKVIQNTEEKQELLILLYKFRYYCLLQINEIQSIKDIPELQDEIAKTINILIDKCIDKKIIENVSNSISLCYNILKYIFFTRIVELERINIKVVKQSQFKQNDEKEGMLYKITIKIYDNKEQEEEHTETVDNLTLLNIRLNKKIELFLV